MILKTFLSLTLAAALSPSLAFADEAISLEANLVSHNTESGPSYGERIYYIKGGAVDPDKFADARGGSHHSADVKADLYTALREKCKEIAMNVQTTQLATDLAKGEIDILSIGTLTSEAICKVSQIPSE